MCLQNTRIKRNSRESSDLCSYIILFMFDKGKKERKKPTNPIRKGNTHFRCLLARRYRFTRVVISYLCTISVRAHECTQILL